MMNITRVLKHFFYPSWRLHQLFPKEALTRIESAISASESKHSGEIRFAIESSLPLQTLWQEKSVKDRAINIFSLLRVWDTEDNNGVLIYILLADHRVEIVADRNINRKVGSGSNKEWQRICHIMEQQFTRDIFGEGSVEGIEAINKVLIKHFPANENNKNELPNRPVIL